MHNLIVAMKANERTMYLKSEIPFEEILPENTYDMDEKGFEFTSPKQSASTYKSQRGKLVFHKRYGEKNPFKVTVVATIPAKCKPLSLLSLRVAIRL
jgi:hypothetical protein